MNQKLLVIPAFLMLTTACSPLVDDQPITLKAAPSTSKTTSTTTQKDNGGTTSSGGTTTQQGGTATAQTNNSSSTTTAQKGTAATKATVQANRSAASDASTALSGNINKAANGTLQLTPTHRTANYQNNITGNYDAGMNGLKTGAISNKVFSGKKFYVNNSSFIALIDPDAAGFKYQTFGQTFGDTGSQGYASTGVIYTPKDSATINATYKGGAMGTYDSASEVVSDMTANLNWGAAEKSLAITTSNSKISTNNITNNKYTALTNDSRFDFTEKLTWDGTKFSNSNAQGYLYGATDAAEVGGTIDKTIGGKSYQAGFGGVKQ